MTAAGIPNALPGPLVRVEQPLVLISQAQRSGGTLLLRLLDGHPQCLVAPFQLRGIDEAAKHALTDPEEAWRALYDPKLALRSRRGHRQRKGAVLDEGDVFPFELEPALQRSIYHACVAERSRPSGRDFFDCYFTSYFNAWLDYRNLAAAPKRWVVGFEPAVASSPSRRNAVSGLYPDGRVISIVRDPWSWYASARRWEPRWRDREEALLHWRRASNGALKWRRQRSKQAARLLRFDRLLTETEETMRRIAAWLGVDFVPGLLEPTFNGRPIRANSAEEVVQYGVLSDRRESSVDPETAARIAELAGDLYERARAASV